MPSWDPTHHRLIYIIQGSKKMKRKNKIGIFALFLLVIGILISGCVQENPETNTTFPGNSAPTITTTITTATTTLPASSITTTLRSPQLSRSDFEISLSIDKKIYHSNEHMNITVVIGSKLQQGDVEVKVYGIKANYYRLNEVELTNLDMGANTIIFSYTTPRCTGCSGISPGEYSINADLVYDDKVIANTTKNIEIKQ